MLFWLLVGFVSVRLLSLLVFSTQGVTTLRVRIMQKLILVRYGSVGGRWLLAGAASSLVTGLVSRDHPCALRPLSSACRSVSTRTLAAR